VIKLDVLLNGDKVDALSLIVHRAIAPTAARSCASQAARHSSRASMFDVAIQAAIGSTRRSPARTVKAMRKDVTGQVLRRRHLAQEVSSSKRRRRARSA
jgi:GTP-binding protein LepA